MTNMHDFFPVCVTQDYMQNQYCSCINVVIVGWLERGFSNHTNVYTHIGIHTQLLTSWSSLVLSWEFVRLLDSRAAASSWFRLYHVHTCIRDRKKEKKTKEKKTGIKCSGKRQTKNMWKEETIFKYDLLPWR